MVEHLTFNQGVPGFIPARVNHLLFRADRSGPPCSVRRLPLRVSQPVRSPEGSGSSVSPSARLSGAIPVIGQAVAASRQPASAIPGGLTQLGVAFGSQG